MNKKLKNALIVFFLTGSILGSMFFNPFVVNSVRGAVGWWDTNYNNYVSITVDPAYIDTDLHNFPVLVVVDSTISAKTDSGNSIRFIDSDNKTQFHHEIESGYNATGNNFIWVNVTNISATTGATFRMYYNQSGAADAQNVTDVWDTNYTVVTHLNDTNTSGVMDSTIYANDGNKKAANEPQELTTNVSEGQQFDSNNGSNDDYIEHGTNGHSSSLHRTAAMNITMEVYFNQLSYNYSTIFYKDNAYSLNTFTDGSIYAYFYNSTTRHRIDSPANFMGDFKKDQYIAYTYNNNKSDNDPAMYLYANTNQSTASPNTAGAAASDTNKLLLGGYTSAGYTINGSITEARLSNIVRNASWLNATYHSLNQTDGFITVGSEQSQTSPQSPTDFIATTIGYTSINVSWTNGTNSTHTRVQRATTGYPASISDGTNIYNGTGEYVVDSGLTEYTRYYYRAWSYNSTLGEWGTFNSSYNNTGPANPTSVTATFSGETNLNISWAIGTDADVTALVRKSGSYPTSINDGTLLQNNSNASYEETMVSGYRYTLYSYNNATGLAASGYQVEWGLLTANCYDEETNDALTFDLFISNQEGDETYYNTHCSNPTNINVNDLPLGDAISIKVSANTSYGNNSERFTGYGSTENQTITYIVLDKEPINKAYTNVTCAGIVADSYPTFTLSGDLITIMPGAASEFNEIIVNYSYKAYEDRFYNMDFEAFSFYELNAYLPPTEGTGTRLYRVTVVGQQGEFSSPPIEDARLVFKRYLPEVGAYTTISSIHTDANGQAYIYLIPEEIYKVNITKTGYISADPEVIPVDSEDPANRIIPLRILPISQPDETYEIFWNTITFTGVMDGDYFKNGNITITYDDSNTTTTNTHVLIYEIWNDTLTLRNSTTNTSVQSFTFKVPGINTTRTHFAKLYFNNSNTFDVSSPVSITILPLYTPQGASISNLDDRITNVIGPFTILVDGVILQASWANIIALFLPIIILCSFGVFNIGAGIFACGVSMGLVQIVYARWFTDTLNPLFVLLSVVIITISIIYIWTKRRAEEDL